MTSDPTDYPSSGNNEVDRLFADYLRRMDSGEKVDVEEFLKDHTEHADALRELIETTQKMDQLVHGIDPSQTSDSFSLGTKLRYFGDYELLEEIGRGGMGVVYKARQISLNRIVAVKMIIAGYLASESSVRRFKREAESVASLKHSAIVPIHEIGEHEGLHYFSMEYVEGPNLAELIREKTVSPKQAAEYVRQLADAIQHAHQQGMLHRDLKPANVLVDKNGKVHITDFGLAIRMSEDAEQITQSGHIVGTPSYMAPEQAADKRGLIGPASDVYSLGAILYELLTGKPPFAAGTTLETLRQVQEEEPTPPSKSNIRVAPDLETIC